MHLLPIHLICTRKPEKIGCWISKVPSGAGMTQAHLATNPPIRKGLGRAGLRRKAPGTQ